MSVADTSAGGLLTLVRTGRASTRSDLVRLTGLSRGAVAARLSALVEGRRPEYVGS